LAPICSIVGRGTRFRVEVPAALIRTAAEIRSTEQAVDSAWLAGKMLAVLDDEDVPRESLVAALSGAGAHCVQASTLTRLVQQLDNEVRFPDALIFDLELRDELDGIEALNHLRRQWECDTPALIVTGRLEAIRTMVIPERCTWLAKPLALGDVVQALDSVMRLRESNQAPAP
jgi:DNA-binding response OmpR family regulator